MIKKQITALLLSFILLLSISASALELNAKGAISINFDTDEVYFEKNADTLMTPASLTKIMTLYIIFEKMADGAFTEETLIPISKNAAALSRDPEATNIKLYEGTTMPVSTLLDAITIISACACSTVMAEYISGSEAEFALLMNKTAAELGIEAIFYDASGLSDDNLISPRGIAALIKTFIEKYPRILEYTSKTEVTINGKKYSSTNRLLPIKNTEYYYPGVDGFKTGTTTKAGKCLAATGKIGEDRVITVAMKTSSNYYRYVDSRKMLHDAFYRADFFGGNLFSTDIRAYINGMEIPCYCKISGEQQLCITAEQLNFYGFDTHFSAEDFTVYIYENPEKEVAPVMHEKLLPGTAEHRIVKNSGLKAVLVKDGELIPLETVFSMNGQCAISFDELGKYYSKIWDGEGRVAEIIITK